MNFIHLLLALLSRKWAASSRCGRCSSPGPQTILYTCSPPIGQLIRYLLIPPRLVPPQALWRLRANETAAEDLRGWKLSPQQVKQLADVIKDNSSCQEVSFLGASGRRSALSRAGSGGGASSSCRLTLCRVVPSLLSFSAGAPAEPDRPRGGCPAGRRPRRPAPSAILESFWQRDRERGRQALGCCPPV